ncbi:MAG: hypothetical protein U1E73_08705 [Planctomycetota bacterium]
MRSFLRPFSLCALLPVAACGGGGGGGGGSNPPIAPNHPPVMQVPSGLIGGGSSFRYEAPIATAATLTFAATDTDGDALHWSVVGDPATAALVGVTLPLTGNAGLFQLPIAAVAAPASAELVVFVEDTHGGAGAVDLLVVRSGPPTIDAVAPDSAFAGQPQYVAITGSAFYLGGTVTTAPRFGGLLGTGVQVLGDALLTCSTPLTLPAGPWSVSVSNGQGSAQLPPTAFSVLPFPPVYAAADTAFDAGAGSAPAAARTGNVLHAVWLEAGAVMHRTSVDHGALWSGGVPLSGAEVPTEPQVVGAGLDAVVAWIGDGGTIYARRSGDGGMTFDPAVVLNPAAVLPATHLRLAAAGDRCYAAWTVGSAAGGTARLQLARSANGGSTWLAPQSVDDQGANQTDHVLACSGDYAWLAFRDARQGGAVTGTYVARSADGGVTWSAGTRLSAPGAATFEPCLCNEGLVLHVAWLVGGALRYASSLNSGINWTSSIELQGNSNGTISEPALACDRGRVFAAYAVAGTTVQCTRVVAAGGAPADTVLTTAAASAAQIRIGARGNYVVVAFRDGDVGTGTARIWQSASGDAGVAFAAAARFGDGAAAQEDPVLAADSAQILLLWRDHRGATPALFVNRDQ